MAIHNKEQPPVRENTGGCFCLHIDKRRRRCYNANKKIF